MSQILRPLFDGDKRVHDFFFDEKTEVIYYLKSMGGRKEKISSGVKRSGAAEIAKAKREAFRRLKLKNAKAKQALGTLVKDQLPLWREIKVSENLDESTMKNIDQAIKRIDGFWGSMFPHEINRDNIAKWFRWLEENYPGQLKEKPIKYLRNFARYLGEKTHDGKPLLPAVPRIADPDYKAVKARRRKKKERIFTADEFCTVYMKGNDVERLAAMFMYTMAARIDETLNLRFGREIILDERPRYQWEIGQNKADLWGKHRLTDRMAEMFRARQSELHAHAGDYIFPQKFDKKKPLKPQMIDWKDWRERAKLDWHWTSHTFRHTCLSNLFSDERNPQALVCKLYRVSFAVAMDTYIHPTEDGIERMRNAIQIDLKPTRPVAETLRAKDKHAKGLQHGGLSETT